MPLCTHQILFCKFHLFCHFDTNVPFATKYSIIDFFSSLEHLVLFATILNCFKTNPGEIQIIFVINQFQTMQSLFSWKITKKVNFASFFFSKRKIYPHICIYLFIMWGRFNSKFSMKPFGLMKFHNQYSILFFLTFRNFTLIKNICCFFFLPTKTLTSGSFDLFTNIKKINKKNAPLNNPF